ncbi:MAG: DUF5615 family PIN-like protein [bacterium]
MKFLIDECTGPSVARWLEENGYDALSISEKLHGYSDTQVLQKAFSENRILITNDKDFGDMIFRQQLPHRGIILLRLEDEQPLNKINTLKNVLKKHMHQIAENFIVVTEKTIRIIHQNIDA